MEPDTAGDPMTDLKWTHRATQKISEHLLALNLVVGRTTVGRLLKDLGYALRVNHKKRTPRLHSRALRNEQFLQISAQRQLFQERGDPVISIDSKKRELVGCFKNPGRTHEKKPREVNDHDFPSDAIGIALPHGLYDLQANRGSVCVGTSHDTAAFAVHSIAHWWTQEGQQRYPHTQRLLILADGGGSNSPRQYLWKDQIQCHLCDALGLSVTLCHYPPGASKWNPIEHRLFSEISKNWAGVPLENYPTILNYLSTTTTKTGLRVKAYLDTADYYDSSIFSLRRTSDSPLSADYLLSSEKIYQFWDFIARKKCCCRTISSVFIKHSRFCCPVRRPLMVG